LQSDISVQVAYWIAFLRNDTKEMESLVQKSLDLPGGQVRLLSEQAETEAYHGRLTKSREFAHSAETLMERNGDKDTAALLLMQEAAREAAMGEFSRIRVLTGEAEKLSQSEDVRTLAALVFAQMGKTSEAEAICRELDKQWPQGTYVQKYWLPTIRAEIDLAQHHPSKALDDLGVATALELSNPEALPVASLHPAYVRGQAYLAAGDGAHAVTEFKKFIDHPGLVINSPLGSLARLQLARAYAASENIDGARQLYNEFFSLWGDADPDLAVLKQAKAEFVKLR
jgi:predicted Zn-dependent protease